VIVAEAARPRKHHLGGRAGRALNYHRFMRVLVLSYETPAHPGAGGPSRLSSLFGPLAAGHRIRVISTGGEPPFGRPPADIELRLVDPGPPIAHQPKAWLRKNAQHYLSGEPWLYELARHHLTALGTIVDEELRSFAPDLVMVEHEELAPLMALLPQGTPCVLDLHNVLIEVQWQNLRRPTIWGTVNAALELFVLARGERRALGRARSTIVVSEPNRRVAHALRRMAPITLIPNGVNVEYFQRSGPPSDRPTIVMTASYHYPPNQQAAHHLLRNVFPAVHEQVPNAELRFVGQRMPDWLETLAASTPGVHIVGMVDDIRPELERAWLAVAPLWKGSGSPLKALEAMAMGTPVVATPRVTKSLRLGPNDGVVVADDASGIAREIVTLLRDDPRRASIAERGAAVARVRFDGRKMAAALEKVWEAAVSRSSERA
jgi:polysaccharide biosynthesis protein PslH